MRIRDKRLKREGNGYIMQKEHTSYNFWLLLQSAIDQSTTTDKRVGRRILPTHPLGNFTRV